MLPKTYRQLLALQESLKRKWLAVNPNLNNKSGIYFLTRNEDGIRYAYVGQAKWVLTRLASHLQGYEQHIDKSLRKHGLYSPENPTGWYVNFINCDESLLDEKEQFYIKMYSQNYQMLNKTIGGQGQGKKGMDCNTERKGYRKGVEYGRAKTLKEIAELFDKYLDAVIKGKPNKTKERKLEYFYNLFGGKNGNTSFEEYNLQDIG